MRLSYLSKINVDAICIRIEKKNHIATGLQ
jgi:hypothetical protein